MFRSLIKVNNDGIIITQNDQIVFFNEQIKQIFEVPPIPVSISDSLENDKPKTANQLSTPPTVKINCETAFTPEIRTDRQLIDNESALTNSRKKKQKRKSPSNDSTYDNVEVSKKRLNARQMLQRDLED